MFGVLRLLLALLVLHAHVWGAQPWSGVFAVLAFFTLSGYLMTLIIHEKYGLDGAGFGRYALNRGLRIFPAYWFALACTLGAIGLITGPEFFQREVADRMIVPQTLGEWLPTVFIFGQWTWLPSLLIPQGWALNVELIFYLALPLFIARKPEYALACFLTSVVYTIWVAKLHLPLGQRYYLPISGMLPFAFGAVIYFYGKRVRASAGFAVLLVLVAFAHVFVYDLVDVERDYVENTPLYLNTLLFGLAVWALADVKPPDWLARLDERCGRLSYPLYLNHFLVLGLLYWYFPELPRGTATTFACVTLASLAFSAFSWWLVERPIEQIRRKVARGEGGKPREADPALEGSLLR